MDTDPITSDRCRVPPNKIGGFREDRKLADILKGTHSELREKVQSINCDTSSNPNDIEDAIWSHHANSRMAVKSGSCSSTLNDSKL